MEVHTHIHMHVTIQRSSSWFTQVTISKINNKYLKNSIFQELHTHISDYKSIFSLITEFTNLKEATTKVNHLFQLFKDALFVLFEKLDFFLPTNFKIVCQILEKKLHFFVLGICILRKRFHWVFFASLPSLGSRHSWFLLNA